MALAQARADIERQQVFDRDRAGHADVLMARMAAVLGALDAYGGASAT